MNRSSIGQQSHYNGLMAEGLAAQIYLARSASLLGQRTRIAGSEIDMIFRDADQTVFVEVKARRTLADAAYAVSPRQSARLAVAAQAWLEREGRQNDDIRFDIVLVDRQGNSEVLENALSFDA